MEARRSGQGRKGNDRELILRDRLNVASRVDFAPHPAINLEFEWEMEIALSLLTSPIQSQVVIILRCYSTGLVHITFALTSQYSAGSDKLSPNLDKRALSTRVSRYLLFHTRDWSSNEWCSVLAPRKLLWRGAEPRPVEELQVTIHSFRVHLRRSKDWTRISESVVTKATCVSS